MELVSSIGAGSAPIRAHPLQTFGLSETFNHLAGPVHAGPFLLGSTMHERAKLETLITALDASSRSLRRDSRGDWHIAGKHGQIFADGKGFLIVVSTDASSRRWNNVKTRLSFCRVTQDGDDEGCLHIDRLPAPAEADLIREAIDLKRRVHLSDAERERRASVLRLNLAA